MPIKAPTAPPSFSWNGYYAGVVAGYSWRDPSIDITGNGAATATYLATGIVPGSIPVDPKGFLGGVQAGFNYQAGTAIFGFETDFSGARIRDGGTVGPGLPLTDLFLCGKGCTTAYRFNSTGEQKLDWFGTVRGRLGVTPYDRLLIFVAGGLAYGHANLTASVLNVSGTQTGFGGFVTPIPACTQICATGSANQWLVGWTLGAGAEFALSNSWTTKIEYLYYDLGSLSVSFSDPRFAAFVFNSTAQYRGNIVRAGLSFKFN
jgi:outer membrane immunogenic protein